MDTDVEKREEKNNPEKQPLTHNMRRQLEDLGFRKPQKRTRTRHKSRGKKGSKSFRKLKEKKMDTQNNTPNTTTPNTNTNGQNNTPTVSGPGTQPTPETMRRSEVREGGKVLLGATIVMIVGLTLQTGARAIWKKYDLL